MEYKAVGVQQSVKIDKESEYDFMTENSWR